MNTFAQALNILSDNKHGYADFLIPTIEQLKKKTKKNKRIG